MVNLSEFSVIFQWFFSTGFKLILNWIWFEFELKINWNWIKVELKRCLPLNRLQSGVDQKWSKYRPKKIKKENPVSIFLYSFLLFCFSYIFVVVVVFLIYFLVSLLSVWESEVKHWQTASSGRYKKTQEVRRKIEDVRRSRREMQDVRVTLQDIRNKTQASRLKT